MPPARTLILRYNENGRKATFLVYSDLLMASESKVASAQLAPPASQAAPAHEGAARAFWGVLTRFESSKLAPYMALRNSIGVLLPLVAGFALNMPRGGVVVASGALNVAYSDRNDPYAQRAKRMLASSVLCALGVLLGALSGNHNAAAVIIALMITVVIINRMVTIPHATRQTVVVLVIALAIGVGTALAAVIIPAWREARESSVRAGRARVGRDHAPFWERTWIDLILLAVAGLVYWRTAAAGYQIVLAPEGVAATSVSYESFLAPLALWIGVGLLVTRIFRHGLAGGRAFVASLFRPLAGGLSPIVAASVSRQARLITRGVVLVTLAFSFAVSTAVFNTTYNVQSRVDAALTNGSDVTITGTTAYPAGPLADSIAKLPGVRAVQAMMHRFAYVGNDLQDLYGVNALTIGEATDLSNAFFASNDAAGTMQKLAAQPDGALLSQETVNDFQLKLGDVINLRLQNAKDHQYHPVPFHFIGVVREFSTAPKDSFILANAGYVASQTGDTAREVVLIRGNVPPSQLAKSVEPLAATLPGARVTDLGSVLKTISSSLTAVDLHGLTWIELSFAILLIAGASGLVLGLGLIERRRDFALLAAMGAKARQLGAFLWTEGLIILISGMALGFVTGFAIAKMLVKVLTGVFDPAPQALAIPWVYLIVLIVAGCLSTALAIVIAQRVAQRRAVETLRTI